jgi:general secretion pathway protein F
MQFRYEAVDSQGKTLQGQVEAAGEREAGRMIRDQGLTVVGIGPAGGTSATAAGAASRRAGEKEKALVMRELAILLKAGVPLAEAVESIGASHGATELGNTFAHLHRKLRGGERFSEALRSAPTKWPDYLHQLTQAGEHTGKLAGALESAANQMEYEQRIAAEVRSALLYPAFLVISGIAATLVIFIVVVPRFANILKGNRSQVPDISVWVLTAGMFVRENLLWVSLGAAALVMAAVAVLANPEYRARLLHIVARLPLLGPWLVQAEIGRWAAMLGTLLENHVPLLKAMELAQQGVRLDPMRAGFEHAARDVRGGKSVVDALSATMLRALATLHENAGRERLKRFLTLLEPVAILLIGGVIGIVMAAVMLAITSMSNVNL